MVEKVWKPDDFELHISLMRSFTNVLRHRFNFAGCVYLLESDFRDIFDWCETMDRNFREAYAPL